MSIVTTDDFTGQFNVSLNRHEKGDFQSFIDFHERKYLIDLLGLDLYKVFVADLTTTPPIQSQNSLFLELFEPVQYLLGCNFYYKYYRYPVGYEVGKLITSHGLKEMLVGFIYVEWLQDQWLKKTSSGTTVVDSENSTVRPSTMQGLSNYYNEAVETYNAIQYHICEKIEEYNTIDPESEWRGVNKEYTPISL